MNRNYLRLLSWIGPQILVGVTVFFAADSAARFQENRDLRQQSQIWASLAAHPGLSVLGIGVDVRGGQATLSGAVESRSEKALAEQIALAVPGVKRVDNRLEVNVVQSQRQRLRLGQHAIALDVDSNRFGGGTT